MPFDPGKLLRKSWDSPDELAHELYVLLQTLVPSMPQVSPRRQTPIPVAALSTRIAQALVGESARRQEQAQRRLGVPIYEAITQNQTSLIDRAQRLPTPSSYQKPSRPPLLGVGQNLQATQLSGPSVGVLEQVTTSPTVTPSEQIAGGQNLTAIQLDQIIPEGEGSPPTEIRAGVVAARSISVPDTAIALRGSVFTTTPPVTEAVDDRVKTMPVSAPTGLRLSPRNEQVASASAGLVLDTEATLVAFSPTPAKTGDDPLYPPTPVPDWDDPTANTPFDEGTLWLGYISADGVPGAQMVGSVSQPAFAPGQGQVTLMDFDPDATNLVQFSGDLVNVYNYGLLPISGGQVWPLQMINNVLWLNPNTVCHAISIGPISPCSGTTPGQGQVACYYLSGGVMTPDEPQNVESWFNITAPTSTHCTVMAVDGTTGLEVLDCP